jgi:hypothetical protein
MGKTEALELINTLTVLDYDIDCEICHYVLVPYDNHTKNVLRLLGKDDEWINLNKKLMGKTKVFDITLIAWEYASWFTGEKFTDY